jgi:hypothetical protein
MADTLIGKPGNTQNAQQHLIIRENIDIRLQKPILQKKQ